MDTEIIKTVSGYLAATFLATVGLSTVINPVGRSKNFGITARPDDKAILGFVQPMGARDLSLGLTIGTLMFQGDQKTAGLVMLIALIVPTMDGWAVWIYNGRLKEAWPHLVGAGVVGGLVIINIANGLNS